MSTPQRALIFGQTNWGEIWTDGRPALDVPRCETLTDLPQSDAIGRRPPRVVEQGFMLGAETHVAFPFRYAVAGVQDEVLVYVSTDEDSPGGVPSARLKCEIELRAISAILSELPEDLGRRGFWLARNLWLAHNAFEHALAGLIAADIDRRMRRQFDILYNGKKLGTAVLKPPA